MARRQPHILRGSPARGAIAEPVDVVTIESRAKSSRVRLRFLFLRQAWMQVVKEDDSTWIERRIARSERHPDEPYAGVGHALARLRNRGATSEEITDLVRGMQAELLFSVCYLLEDPGEVEEEVAHIAWALVQVDAEGNALEHLSGLHESLLETDPTGREMRPRETGS